MARGGPFLKLRKVERELQEKHEGSISGTELNEALILKLWKVGRELQEKHEGSISGTELNEALKREGVKPASILVTDYCYNLCNKYHYKDDVDIIKPTFKISRLFICTERGKGRIAGKFRFVDKDYRYKGTVFHEQKKPNKWFEVGSWEEGNFTKFPKRELEAPPEFRDIEELEQERLRPAGEQTSEEQLDDAAQRGFAGETKLSKSGRRVTQEELAKALQKVTEIGRRGEELLNKHFAALLENGHIKSYEWIANHNAVSPFDFRLEDKSGRRKIEVKSTTGGFDQIIHISMAELVEMRGSKEDYQLYRLYELEDGQATLKIAPNMRDFATDLLQHLCALPNGITVDSISVKPATLPFEKTKSQLIC